jgi:chromosome segregation protein
VGPKVILRGSQAAHQGLLERERERREKERLLELARTGCESETRKRDELKSKMALKISERDARLDQTRGFKTEYELLRRECEEVRERIRERGEEMRLCEAERVQSVQEGESIGGLLTSHRDRLKTLEGEQETAVRELGEIEESARALRRRTEEAAAGKTQCEYECAALEDRRKNHATMLEQLRRRLEEEGEKTQRYRDRIQEYQRRTAEIRTQNETLEKELLGIRASLQSEELEIHRLSEMRERLQERKRRAAQESAREEKSLADVSREFHQTALSIQELEYRLTGLFERLQQSYQIDLRTVEPDAGERVLAETEIAQLGSEIQALKDRLSEVGTVNLLAVEEYDELKKRFDFLSSQKQDLEKAREELMEAIRKINRTTRKLFEETYANVRKNFQEYFRILFGGGQADLVMLDETNPLDSGIDIVARPPGKKMQNISSYSGGEKAMTAIALLFALFQIKPSPFSVLDEIDAPLDEANIDRFLTVLESFLKSTQFIVVTHNRKTIARGDTLYGVTMQEAGVSKVVSVQLEEDSSGKSEAVTDRSLSASISLK